MLLLMKELVHIFELVSLPSRRGPLSTSAFFKSYLLGWTAEGFPCRRRSPGRLIS